MCVQVHVKHRGSNAAAPNLAESLRAGVDRASVYVHLPVPYVVFQPSKRLLFAARKFRTFGFGQLCQLPRENLRLSTFTFSRLGIVLEIFLIVCGNL